MQTSFLFERPTDQCRGPQNVIIVIAIKIIVLITINITIIAIIVNIISFVVIPILNSGDPQIVACVSLFLVKE